jgi:alpha-tubulin suppressor-like RCC1 family protein
MLNMKPFLGRLGAAFILIAGLLSFSAPSPAVVRADINGAPASAPSDRAAMGRISAGKFNTCYVQSGSVYCWGNNASHQVDSSSVSPRSKAVKVIGIDTAVSVSVGHAFACAVLQSGSVQCWGGNSAGQANSGTPGADSTSPVTISSLADVVAVATGTAHACALSTTSGVKCWGSGISGQIGDGTNNMYSPVSSVTGLDQTAGVTAVSAGNGFSCAVLGDKTVKCWGTNDYGQLGRNLGGMYTQTTPVVVDTFSPPSVPLADVVAISSGESDTCAVVLSGNVWCWGRNTYGQRGMGTTRSSVGGYLENATLVQTSNSNPSGLDGVRAISVGAGHVCALRTLNRRSCWGDNTKGQLGTGSSGINILYPTSVAATSGISNWVAVAAGGNHSCSLSDVNDLYCWGEDSDGELGNERSSSQKDAPFAVVGAISQATSFSAPTAKRMNESGFTLSATSDSGIIPTLTSSTQSVCVIESGVVTLKAAGVCTINALLGAVGIFTAGETVSRNIQVSGIQPSSTTSDATSIATTSAVLNGTANPGYIATTTTFTYGTSADLSGATTSAAGTSLSGSSVQATTVSLTGLLPGTKYYFRVSSTNAEGTAVGEIRSFTTLGGKPSATTAIASGVSANRATLNASVNANGVSTTVKYRVGKSADLSGDVTVYEGRTVTDFADESVPVSISSLSELVTYYYRVEAANSFGTATGEIRSFTTARPVGVTINSAAEFTNKKSVVLSVTGAAGSVSAIVSNDGGFGASETFTLVDGSAEINWTLISSRDERLPKQVYVKFVSRFGTQSSNYQDDIILDTTAPVLSTATAVAAAAPETAVSVASVRAKKKNGARITVRASDANSGIGSVEMRTSARKKATSVKYANPKAKSQTLTVNTKAKTLQVRVIDRAGNPSPWKTVRVK